MVRINGSLKPLDGFGQVTPEGLRRTLYAFLTQKQREKFETNLELDLSYSVRGLARFRVNIYQQRESIGAAFRVIPYEIKPLEELGVPAVVGTFAGLPRGLVLVTGPTGSGKSTTLASIVDLANRTREDHIMTVEDPIEFLHRHKKCVVNQREVGQDTHSFANALKHVLRQDPDIILVGEMRDLETISVALTAAETGHLVFATLHTQDAAQTIDRVIDVFPAAPAGAGPHAARRRHPGRRLPDAGQARRTRPGRAVATEVLVATPAIRNLIREGKTHQIYSAMQAGAKQGMHTMDQHLADLVKTGKIIYETGLEKCHHVEDFNRLTGRFSGGSQGAAGMGDRSPWAAPSYGSQTPLMATAQKTFEYAVRDKSGKIVKGRVEADNQAAVANRLREMGLAAVSISEVGTGGLNAEINIPGLRREQDLAQGPRDHVAPAGDDDRLGPVAAAGADHPGGPDRVQAAGQGRRPGAQRRRGRHGASRPRWPSTPTSFPPLMINMVKAGEVGGFLDQVLVSVANNFEAEVKLRGKIKSAMTYPVVVFVVAILAVDRHAAVHRARCSPACSPASVASCRCRPRSSCGCRRS